MSTIAHPVTAKKPNFMAIAGIGVLVVLAWLVFSLYQRLSVTTQATIPTARVQQSDVSLPIFARGEIRGGNSQVLSAPMTGGTELHIRYLRPNGDPVKKGDVVVEFDTTDQEYAFSEANSDLAEAKQHIEQASAQLAADTEEDRYALSKAQTDLELAELEARKNPILAAITAKQNDLAVALAKDKLAQLQQDGANKKATDTAGIQIQQAAQGKAQAKLVTAKQNIEAMTLRAERDGYIAVRTNTNTNFITEGMELPIFQVGDSVRPGMGIAEIPDLTHWEVAATISELDRGHLAAGDKVTVNVVALPHAVLQGHVTDIGSTAGSPWDRHFECKVALDSVTPRLRPGMSAKVEITTENLKNALWVPAQALFESDGKTFVYMQSGKTFVRRDVTLIRRNETKVVLKGIEAGKQVALSNPTEQAAPKKAVGKSALEALPK